MTFTIGETVGSYRVVAQLGQGGMATVFKAYHPGLDRYVALKVLHPAFKEDSNFAQRFRREARIVARLEHPNIVPVYDYAEHRGLAYLVMRFIDGETLKARLRRGPLRPDQIVQVARDLGAALDYAHQQGILHRDIKPSNVLLAGDPADPDALGHIFLADFGLARIAESGESTLSRDMMMGTPQYISPEQARGDKELDVGADIYSLGVVLYEMVTGRVPFNADTPYSIIHDHIFSPLPLPTSIRPDLPEPVERVLLKALSKEHTDRYASVQNFVDAFTAAMQTGVALLAPSSSTATVVHTAARSPEQTRSRRRVWLWLALGAAAIVLCLLSLLTLRNLGQKRQTQATATAEAQAASATATALALTPEIDFPAGTDPALAGEIRHLLEKVELTPDDPLLHFDLGKAYLEANMVKEGNLQLQQAVELRPPDEALYLEIGQILTAAKAKALAAQVYTVGIEVLPESKPLRTNLAMSLWRLGAPEGEPKLAEELARRYLAVAPDQPLPHVLLARALISQGKMEEAREEIDLAMEMPPDTAEKRLVYALWLRKDRQPVAAARELRLALELVGDQEWLRLEIERELEQTN